MKRKDLIRQIEEYRDSRVITYVTSTRENIDSEIEESDIIHFREHLDKICASCKKLDLFLFSYGGELEAAWELVNLLREYNVDFSVLIPYHARSAATLIALGAKEVLMGKMGSLGPIDPSIRIHGGELSGMSLSATDVDSYEDFLRDEYDIKDPQDKMKAFEMLGQNVSPVLLGKVYRNYLETKKDAEKMLRRNIKDPKKVKKIVRCFIKDVKTHNHSISRSEARKSGLNVTFADKKMEKLMWDLYKQYEFTMKMDLPYIDEPPKEKERRDVPLTYIESLELTNIKTSILHFKKLDYPEGSKLIAQDEEEVILTPDGQTIPLIPTGRLIAANDFIYDKTEDIYWS
ncbi:MAG: hypothetical protein R3B71_03565 [Candidatus Gracilibacteria bacterium]|nr:hypothetical protein [Candidatus Peregrinibacteria bacterium]